MAENHNAYSRRVILEFMDENPYQAPEPSAAIPNVPPPKVPLFRQLISAIFLAVGLMLTFVTMFDLRLLAEPRLVVPKVRWLVELGVIGLIASGLAATTSYMLAYCIQRPRRG